MWGKTRCQRSDFQSFLQCVSGPTDANTQKHNCWFCDFTFSSVVHITFFLYPPSMCCAARSTFVSSICKSHLEFSARMFHRIFRRIAFIEKNSSEHIQSVIRFTMNRYLEFNLFSILRHTIAWITFERAAHRRFHSNRISCDTQSSMRFQKRIPFHFFLALIHFAGIHWKEFIFGGISFFFHLRCCCECAFRCDLITLIKLISMCNNGGEDCSRSTH